MNTYFKLYTPGSLVRAKREIEIVYRDRPVGLKAEFTGDRYRFTLPPVLDTKMIHRDRSSRSRPRAAECLWDSHPPG